MSFGSTAQVKAIISSRMRGYRYHEQACVWEGESQFPVAVSMYMHAQVQKLILILYSLAMVCLGSTKVN